MGHVKRFALLGVLVVSLIVIVYKFAEYCTDTGTWYEVNTWKGRYGK
jgi:hypothetical protein